MKSTNAKLKTRGTLQALSRRFMGSRPHLHATTAGLSPSIHPFLTSRIVSSKENYPIRVVLKIMAPFWLLVILRHLVFRGTKKVLEAKDAACGKRTAVAEARAAELESKLRQLHASSAHVQDLHIIPQGVRVGM